MTNSRKNVTKHFPQAFRLVGKFLYRWGAIEELIATNIIQFLKMSGPEPDIILARVTFRDKVAILSTLVTLAYGKDGKSQSEESQDVFKKIDSFNRTYRNVLAHTPFQPHKNGIELKRRVLAKGKYSAPKTIWDAEFFNKRFSEIDSFEDQIEAIIKDIKRRDGPKRIAKALVSAHRKGWLGAQINELVGGNLTTGAPTFTLPVLGLGGGPARKHGA